MLIIAWLLVCRLLRVYYLLRHRRRSQYKAMFIILHIVTNAIITAHGRPIAKASLHGSRQIVVKHY